MPAFIPTPPNSLFLHVPRLHWSSFWCWWSTNVWDGKSRWLREYYGSVTLSDYVDSPFFFFFLNNCSPAATVRSSQRKSRLHPLSMECSLGKLCSFVLFTRGWAEMRLEIGWITDQLWLQFSNLGKKKKKSKNASFHSGFLLMTCIQTYYTKTSWRKDLKWRWWELLTSNHSIIEYSNFTNIDTMACTLWV